MVSWDARGSIHPKKDLKVNEKALKRPVLPSCGGRKSHSGLSVPVRCFAVWDLAASSGQNTDIFRDSQQRNPTI